MDQPYIRNDFAEALTETLERGIEKTRLPVDGLYYSVLVGFKAFSDLDFLYCLLYLYDEPGDTLTRCYAEGKRADLTALFSCVSDTITFDHIQSPVLPLVALYALLPTLDKVRGYKLKLLRRNE